MRTFYVRPQRDAEGGDGAGDGTTYDNAWNGMDDVRLVGHVRGRPGAALAVAAAPAVPAVSWPSSCRMALYFEDTAPRPLPRRELSVAVRPAGLAGGDARCATPATRVSIICPTGKGYEKKLEVIDGIAHLPLRPAGRGRRRAAAMLLEYSAALFWTFLLSCRVLFDARLRRDPRLQSARPVLPDRRLLQAASARSSSSTTTTSTPSSTRPSSAAATSSGS